MCRGYQVGTLALRARDLWTGQISPRKTETCPIWQVFRSESRFVGQICAKLGKSQGSQPEISPFGGRTRAGQTFPSEPTQHNTTGPEQSDARTAHKPWRHGSHPTGPHFGSCHGHAPGTVPGFGCCQKSYTPIKRAPVPCGPLLWATSVYKEPEHHCPQPTVPRYFSPGKLAANA